jgi:hypothetical protein
MAANPLRSLAAYSVFLADLLDRPTVNRSTVGVWSVSPYTGVSEGEVWFKRGLRLRMREELDFAEAVITAYGYEVYREDEKLFWYDDFPHPNDANLAITYPHHKHVPPDIKHNRIPAPGLSFEHPNMPQIVAEIEQLLLQPEATS